MTRPIILCGLGRVGCRVLDCLIAAHLPVVVIDTICRPDDPRLRGARLIVGDCSRPDLLEQAGLADARGVLILTTDDLLNISTALAVRGLNDTVPVVLRMFNQNLVDRLGRAVSKVFTLSTSSLTAPILATTALTGPVLGTYRLDESPQGLRQVAELLVGAESPWHDRPMTCLTTAHDVTVVAHFPVGGGARLCDVPPDAVLHAGDRLVLHGAPRDLRPLMSDDDRTPAELRWAHWPYRLGRILARTVRDLEPAVLLSALVLAGVVAVSTVMLAANVRDYSVPRALLRTVSIMATAAPLGDEDFSGSPVMQVFVSALRIVGAVLLAAFTAAVTQYLLRAKLSGALEARRIPESGHFLVCGLSGVGFRVVEELLRLKERVVVINNNAAGRFVATARRMGAVVLIGDATILELLRQANAGAARAVVPTTSNDLTNLEIALLVRELNPDQRVVPLLNEPKFARMLREAAGVRLAVSESALAAPAFLAGLYGDRVASVFFVQERLFAILDLRVEEQDAFVGAPLRAVAADYGLLPVALTRPGAAPTTRPAGDEPLRPGDRLHAVIELGDLERFLQRQSVAAAARDE